MCKECERFKLLLKLKRGDLLRCPVDDTERVNRLYDDIDALALALAQHECSHAKGWERWPVVIPVLDHGRLN